jgi:hypothetical protein
MEGTIKGAENSIYRSGPKPKEEVSSNTEVAETPEISLISQMNQNMAREAKCYLYSFP